MPKDLPEYLNMYFHMYVCVQMQVCTLETQLMACESSRYLKLRNNVTKHRNHVEVNDILGGRMDFFF